MLSCYNKYIIKPCYYRFVLFYQQTYKFLFNDIKKHHTFTQSKQLRVSLSLFTMITVIGIFEDNNLAEEAALYLQANDFKNENIDVHSGANERVDEFFNHLIADEKDAAHYASIAKQGSVVTVHAMSAREAQEAVDVFNNYGAIDVNAARGLLVERIVSEDKRLRGNN